MALVLLLLGIDRLGRGECPQPERSERHTQRYEEGLWKMIVVLFTNSFPYDFAAEQNFFMGEVKVLSERFDRVILVPRTVRGNLLSVPAGVEVDVSFAKHFTLGRRLALSALALFSKEFYLDIRNHLPASLAPGYLRRLFSF